MDKIKALALEKQLKGTTFLGYEVLELINNGKSAAVFKASKDNKIFALKVFDIELVERFGHEVQGQRIEQEVALKDHTIKNLVKIYDGGNTSIDGQNFHYIAMEFIDGVNLKDYIQSNNINQKFILSTLKILMDVTEELLVQKQIAHRDIKPENIMVGNDGVITLMDLGVLKLVGTRSFSDDEEKSFVGTLRYAPPEFLLRQEVDSADGWRAVNLYQIGATLHDLIMKQELFKDKTPYTNLVIAIKDDIPVVTNDNYRYDLLQATRDMLTKDWQKRLSLVSKERLNALVSLEDIKDNTFEATFEELQRIRLGSQANWDELEKLQRTKQELNVKKKEIAEKLANVIDQRFEFLKSKGVFNSFKRTKKFTFHNDFYRVNDNTLIQNYLYELEGDLKSGFPKNLYVLVRMSNDETSLAEIELWGVFPSIPINQYTLENPQKFITDVIQQKVLFQNNQNYNLNTIDIFKGVINFDNSFYQHLNSQIAKFISKALKSVEDVVNSEIAWQKQIAQSNQTFHSRVTSGNGTRIIDMNIWNQ